MNHPPNRPPNLPKKTDVVVIGGGVIGCGTAYYLARDGLSVVVCEKGAIGGEQSGRNWGFVRKQGRDPAELPLMMESDRLWSRLERQLQCDLGLVRAGTLYLSDSERSYRANLAWLEHARTFGLDSRHLSAAELSALLPQMNHCTRGALYTASDARAEPAKVTAALAAAVVRLGGVVLPRCAVRGVDIEAGRVAGVVSEHGRIRAPLVVCAGGAWSSYFCRNLGLTFPQLKVVGSVLRTAPAPLVAQPAIWSHGLGMRRRQDGGYNVACGGHIDCDITPDYLRFFGQFVRGYGRAHRQHGGEAIRLKLGARFFREWAWPSRWPLDRITPFEKIRTLAPAPNHKLLQKAHRQLGQTFPALADIAVQQRWAGMIEVTPDELPVIDEVEKVPGFFLASGFSGHGFGIGPGAGKATAQRVCGKPTCVDLSPFRWSRFG